MADISGYTQSEENQFGPAEQTPETAATNSLAKVTPKTIRDAQSYPYRLAAQARKTANQ